MGAPAVTPTTHDIRVRNVSRTVRKVGNRTGGVPSATQVAKAMGFSSSGPLYSYLRTQTHETHLEAMDRAWLYAGYQRHGHGQVSQTTTGGDKMRTFHESTKNLAQKAWERVEEMLEGGHYTVEEMATVLGYANRYSFTQSFGRRVTLSMDKQDKVTELYRTIQRADMARARAPEPESDHTSNLTVLWEEVAEAAQLLNTALEEVQQNTPPVLLSPQVAKWKQMAKEITAILGGR